MPCNRHTLHFLRCRQCCDKHKLVLLFYNNNGNRGNPGNVRFMVRYTSYVLLNQTTCVEFCYETRLIVNVPRLNSGMR